MGKASSRSTAARRAAETFLGKGQKRSTAFKEEQAREQEALELKTKRLRELRLAKEAEDDALRASEAPSALKPSRPRKLKQP